MQLPQLLKHYNLNPQQLIKLLNENGINPDLKFIKQVPDSWFHILSNAKDINSPATAELVNSYSSSKLETVEEEPKIEKITLSDLNNILQDVPTTLVSEDGKKNSFKNFERSKQEEEKEFFWAYVKYVAEDNSHAYVKRLFNLNQIERWKLIAKDEHDFKVLIDNNTIEKEQIIVCSCSSINSEKRKGQIEAITFTGINKKVNRISTVSILSGPLATTLFRVNQLDPPPAEPKKLVYFQLNIFKEQYHLKFLPYLEKPEVESHQEACEAYQHILLGKELSDSNITILKDLSQIIDDVEKLLPFQEEAFCKQRDEIFNDYNDSKTGRFLKNWMVLCPNLIIIENLNYPVARGFFLEKWFNSLLPPDFWGEGLEQLFINYLAENTEQELRFSFLKFRKILASDQEESYNQLLSKYLNDSEVTGTGVYLKLCDVAATAFGNLAATLKADLLNKVSAGTKLELWLFNHVTDFPRAEAIRLFNTCTPEQQDKIFEQLEEREIGCLIQHLSTANNPLTLQRCRNLVEKDILKQLKAISLDLESDGEQIKEFAWGNPEEWFSGESLDKVESLIKTFQSKVLEFEPLLVGQNIIDFDLPILKKKGVTSIKDQVWDTLLVEMALSPGLRHYALQTSHHALSDATITLKLFINQVLRLITCDEGDWQLLKLIFDQGTQQVMEDFRASLVLKWLNNFELEVELLTYFRPQPKPSTLLTTLTEQLDASAAGLKVILGSRDFWEELRTIPNLRFYTFNNADTRFCELAEEVLLEQLADYPFELVIAKRFFSYCRKTGVSPLPVNLPPIVRIRLSEKSDFAIALTAPLEPDWSIEQIACLDIYELAKHEEELLNADNIQVYVVEPDLVSLTFKELLKEVELSYIIQNPAVEHLWIRFSGGQSFIEITRDQALTLQVEIPDGITNLWIEKYVYGKYRIWGNYNWENHLAGFPSEKVTILEREKTNFPKEQASYLFVDQKKLQSDIGITRFNPESIYRSRYWVIQKELIEGIIKTENKNKPLVLLIQRKDEVGTLEQYFNSLGYYIPNSEMLLGRRLELLHQSSRSRKILIAAVSEVSQIINANYLGPLNIAWDSFNLYENYYLAKGSALFDKSITTSAEISISTQQKGIDEEDANAELDSENSSEGNNFLQREIFFLLKLQVPLINRLRSLLLDDHLESKLWLMDARIEDFPSLGDNWNAKKVTFKVWEKKESYDSDAKVADACIISPKPENALPFSLEVTKAILSSVFLPANAKWHDYQHEYLDKILPAKNNLLVSLPTGGGKSLLFQAPALFRSSFTNRLTIVITPLKALMEDQVKALWKLGFYGSVDFINQDKSDELQNIYRRLAGGELSMLFITPERFRSGGFIKAFVERFKNDGGLEYAVYDEAHCISQWGHEFRPDYLYSGKAIQRYKDANDRKFPVLLFSATVSEMIYRDLNIIFK